MRRVLFGLTSFVVLALTVYLGAQSGDGQFKLRMKLVDAETGEAISGIVRVLADDGRMLELPGLFARTAGLVKDLPNVHWYCIPASGAETTVPRGKWRIEVVSGLETKLVSTDLDLREKAPGEITLRLPALFRPEKDGWVAGNTHLHLRNFTLEKSDAYLRSIPSADRLRVMFISYLERDKDDLSYITNKYPIGDVPQFATTGVLFNNGEEHRNNFKAFGQGYGHVMFLNIKNLVKPVSIGPGIMNAGFDDVPLRDGIDDARKQGGTIIWCHNTNGHEDVPSAVTGRLDAINVYDGSRTGSYEENYYRYLNIGLRMPISTGTDWFMYDFSRVYAKVIGKLTIASWLDAVKAGRCVATNGPMLTLDVNGKSLGDVLDLREPTTVTIRARAIGRHPISRLELIQNGRIVKTKLAEAKTPGEVELTHTVRLQEPAWFAVRIESDAKNEFGRTPFAHSSPVYVKYEGKEVLDVESGQTLLKQVEEGQGIVRAAGHFSTPDARQRVEKLYEDAARNIRDRINARHN